MIHETCLLSAVRTVIRADSDPVRQALFANLKESHVLVRFVFAVHEAFKSTPISAVLVSSYGLGVFLTVPAPRRRRALLIVGGQTRQCQTAGGADRGLARAR